MRYHVTIGRRTRTIDAEPKGGSLFQVSIDGGEARIVDAMQVETQITSVLVGDRSHEVLLENDGDRVVAQVQGVTYDMDVIDDRRHRLRAAHGPATVSGPVVVRSPMPGKVVKVLVQVGQEVTENQGLVIVEAMKMENELRSPKAGRIETIKAVEGQTVESRAELITIV